MFPKAHAAAYVLSVQSVWLGGKLYYPREYYAVYFSTRCDAYDIETIDSRKRCCVWHRRRRNCSMKSTAAVKTSNKEEGLMGCF